MSAVSNPQQSLSAATIPVETESTVIEVEGMTCVGCEPHINETLKNLNGVVSAEASYQNKNVKVEYNAKQITLDQIKKAIDEIGYKAK